MRPMEDLPTKQQSGAFAVMSEALRGTESEILGLLGEPRYAARGTDLEAHLARVRALSRELSTWTSSPPADPQKQSQIEEILGVIEAVRAIREAGAA